MFVFTHTHTHTHTPSWGIPLLRRGVVIPIWKRQIHNVLPLKRPVPKAVMLPTTTVLQQLHKVFYSASTLLLLTNKQINNLKGTTSNNQTYMETIDIFLCRRSISSDHKREGVHLDDPLEWQNLILNLKNLTFLPEIGRKVHQQRFTCVFYWNLNHSLSTWWTSWKAQKIVLFIKEEI